MTVTNGKLVPIGDPRAGYFPKLIDEGVFLRIQAIIARRTFGTGKRGTGYTNIFNGLLRCGTCGATLRLHKSGSNSKFTHMYFRCVDAMRNISSCKSFKVEDVYRKLLPAVMEHVLDAVLLASRVSELRDQLDIELVRLDDARRTQQKLLEMLEGGSEGSGSGSASLDKLLHARLREVSQSVDQLEATCLDLKARLEDSTSVWDEEANDATIGAAVSAVFDLTKVVERCSLHDKLSRAIEHIWLYPGIAAVQRIGEDFVRWMPLEPEAASRVMNPPEIPPIRKHHKRKATA